MNSKKKLFTIKEANQMLPLVKRIVDDILRIGQAMRSLSLESDKKEGAEVELQKLIDQLDELFDELESLGCSYKDWNFSMGLVDFPTLINGREALLCWCSNEKEVKYYHDLELGFAGRKVVQSDV